MAPHGKQFTLYTHETGPNGWKVVFALKHLDLTYESIYLDLHHGEHKKPEFLKINPNGRIPALIDHQNDDLIIWESCAILLYLVEKYDPEHKISARTANEKAEQLQWLFFQASGQGPYFGQATYFRFLHPEKLPGAIERYQNETLRVLGVLEGVLAQREWLVGGRMTIADISFIPWNRVAFKLVFDEATAPDFETRFPAVMRWHKRLCADLKIAETLAEQAAFLTK